jgi:hypothetical protein
MNNTSSSRLPTFKRQHRYAPELLFARASIRQSFYSPELLLAKASIRIMAFTSPAFVSAAVLLLEAGGDLNQQHEVHPVTLSAVR